MFFHHTGDRGKIALLVIRNIVLFLPLRPYGFTIPIHGMLQSPFDGMTRGMLVEYFFGRTHIILGILAWKFHWCYMILLCLNVKGFGTCRKVHEGKFTRGKRWRVVFFVREHRFTSYIINVVDYFLCDRLLCIFLQAFCGWFLRLGVPFSQFGASICWTKRHFFASVLHTAAGTQQSTHLLKGASCYTLQLIFTNMASQQEISHVPIARKYKSRKPRSIFWAILQPFVKFITEDKSSFRCFGPAATLGKYHLFYPFWGHVFSSNSEAVEGQGNLGPWKKQVSQWM